MAKRSKAGPDGPTPSDLRNRLGANLRQLTRDASSISALCRELGINRTQFNRYLSGESFPRPDVLHRICTFFRVDARILLEPVGDISPGRHDLLNHPQVSQFVGAGSLCIEESLFPSGFYLFSRRSFMDDGRFVQGLVYIYREDGYTFIRGLEAKQAMRQQGLPTDVRSREFRGFLLPQEGGIAMLVARHNSMTCSFNFLAHVPSFENNFWVGYTARTVQESMTGQRVARVVYEHLGRETGQIMTAARAAGLCSADQLVPYHRTQLQVDTPFA